MQIYKCTDPRFRRYGRVLEGYDFTELMKAMSTTPLPSDVTYVPSVAELEELPICKEFSERAYGEMPIQIGYCNGNNHKLNAVEYHRDSELNIAVTDAILILGKQEDIAEDFTYDTSKMEAFLIPKGVGVEVFATTLHYAPCNVDDGGFRVVVVLPKGTNFECKCTHEKGEDALLAAVNKWLIGHKEGGLPEGSFIGLVGENLTV